MLMTQPTLCDLCIHINIDNSSELQCWIIVEVLRKTKNTQVFANHSCIQLPANCPGTTKVPSTCSGVLSFLFPKCPSEQSKPPGVDLLSKYRRNLANVPVFCAQPGVQTLRRPVQVCGCGPGIMHSLTDSEFTHYISRCFPGVHTLVHCGGTSHRGSIEISNSRPGIPNVG